MRGPLGSVLLCVAAAALLRFNLWRALLCLWPRGLRSEWDAPAEGLELPEPLAVAGRELLAEGFVPLGLRLEQAPLGPTRSLYELAHAPARVYATLYLASDGEPRFYLLSPLQGGGFVLSANHRRERGDEARGYLSSGLEGVAPARLLRAHLRRLVGLQPEGSYTAEGRDQAERDWMERFGRFELRQKNVRGLLWSLTAVGLVAYALLGM